MNTDLDVVREEIIVERARKNGGECFLDYGEASAAIRLTEKGVGHWEQRHPFIATFVLAVSGANENERSNDECH